MLDWCARRDAWIAQSVTSNLQIDITRFHGGAKLSDGLIGLRQQCTGCTADRPGCLGEQDKPGLPLPRGPARPAATWMLQRLAASRLGHSRMMGANNTPEKQVMDTTAS